MTMSDQVKSLESISDTELIRRLEKIHSKEREATLSFLLHLNEVDRRRLHLVKGYKSLFDYCVRRFHYSESAANRRIRTARCIRDFPEVYGMLSRGELSLCTVTQIAGIIKKENSKGLLLEVRNRSMREVGMIVSRHCPGSGYRDRVRPVYIKRYIPVSEVPDHEGIVSDAEGRIAAGMRADSKIAGFAGEAEADAGTFCAGLELSGGQAPQHADASGAGLQISGNQAPLPSVEGGKKFTASAGGKKSDTAGGGDSQNKVDLMVLEKKFELKFTVEPGCMEKLDRVRSLLSNRYPRRLELGRVLDILLDEYLDRNSPEGRIKRREKRAAKKAKLRTQMDQSKRDLSGKKGNNNPKSQDTHKKHPANKGLNATKIRSRRIPQRVRDEVFARDGCRCTFVGDDGVRCEETDYLQIDHIVPFARGGDNSAGNLRLLCTDHNRLAAEKAYSKDFMKQFYRKE